MRFAFVVKHRPIRPVSWLCEAPDVPRSGPHAWHNRPATAREILDCKLVTAVEPGFKASDRTYGASHAWRDVLEGGLRASPGLNGWCGTLPCGRDAVAVGGQKTMRLVPTCSTTSNASKARGDGL